MLEVCNLSKDYGPFHAVRDISFSAKPGEVVGFLGPNGAGKTTTMRLITGYLPPSAGEVKVDGLVVRTNALEAKRRIGYLPEQPPVYPELTVDEYLHLCGRLRHLPGRKRKDAIERACKRTGLHDVRHRVIGHLSKGYRQRVGIAQAILHDPPLLILDEPTAGLDPRQILEIRHLLRELAGNHTVILSTHILPEAAATCERLVIINRGRLVAEDTPENLTQRLKHTDTLEVGVRGPEAAITAALSALDGVLSCRPSHRRGEVGVWQLETRDRGVREVLARCIVANGWGLDEMRPVELSLEEIFLSLTGEVETRPAGLLPPAPPLLGLIPGDAPGEVLGDAPGDAIAKLEAGAQPPAGSGGAQ